MKHMGTAVILTALLAVADLAPAQAPDGWRLSVGAGPGVLLSGHDRSVDGQKTTGVRVGLEKRMTDRLALGVEWLATWPSNDLVTENRHHVGVTAAVFPFGGGPALHAGVGLGLATIVTQEGPPEDGVGDVNIDIGDTMGPGATAGVSWDIRLGGGLTVTPNAEALVQRIEGFTLGHVFFGVRIGAGR